VHCRTAQVDREASVKDLLEVLLPALRLPEYHFFSLRPAVGQHHDVRATPAQRSASPSLPSLPLTSIGHPVASG
jgi:hypothetical protein